MAIAPRKIYTSTMSNYTDVEWDQRITEAIERAVGFYSDETNHRIDLVLEVLTSYQTDVDKIPAIEQKIERIDENVYLLRQGEKEIFRDMRKLDDRIAILEAYDA